MHDLIAAIREGNRVSGRPEVAATSARLALLVTLEDLGERLAPHELQALASSLPLVASQVLLRARRDPRDVAAWVAPHLRRLALAALADLAPRPVAEQLTVWARGVSCPVARRRLPPASAPTVEVPALRRSQLPTMPAPPRAAATVRAEVLAETVRPAHAA